jgi:hypothetical protein
MQDDRTHQERLQRNSPPAGIAGILQSKDSETEAAEAACPAFGYLRGIRDTGASVEFRFRAGNSIWFSYGLLAMWQFDPSEGLLLKFSGDVLYLVLIRGSNLDKPLKEGAIDLIHAGLQRHRVLWVREMAEEEIRQVADNGPTIDSIEVNDFESNAEAKEWLRNKAPAFLREQRT